MKTNQVSFARALTGIYPRKYILLQGMVLFVALAITLSGMAQAAQQGSGQAASSFATSGGAEQALPVVEVYKSAQCGCCKAWAEHLQKNGFTVILHDVGDVPAARKKLGMPSQYAQGTPQGHRLGRAFHAARLARYGKRTPHSL